MFYALYLFTFGFGSVFTLLALFSGFIGSAEVEKELHFDADTEHDFSPEQDFDTDIDSSFDFDADLDCTSPNDIDPTLLPELIRKNLSIATHRKNLPAKHPPYRPWFQLRFYTSAAQFFGLTGIIFTFLEVSKWVTFATSCSLALLAGIIVTYTLYSVNLRGGGKISSMADLIGKTGNIVLSPSPTKLGTVKMIFDGKIMELTCKTLEEEPFHAGDEVIVYAADSDYLFVAPLSVVNDLDIDLPLISEV